MSDDMLKGFVLGPAASAGVALLLIATAPPKIPPFEQDRTTNTYVRHQRIGQYEDLTIEKSPYVVINGQGFVTWVEKR
jgi:hypothetical protein